MKIRNFQLVARLPVGRLRVPTREQQLYPRGNACRDLRSRITACPQISLCDWPRVEAQYLALVDGNSVEGSAIEIPNEATAAKIAEYEI